MAVEPGKRYYFMSHVYHHFIATVVEITGKREADMKNIVRVQSSTRDWETFFKLGMGDETVTNRKRFPDGGMTWFAYFEWKHKE